MHSEKHLIWMHPGQLLISFVPMSFCSDFCHQKRRLKISLKVFCRIGLLVPIEMEIKSLICTEPLNTVAQELCLSRLSTEQNFIQCSWAPRKGLYEVQRLLAFHLSVMRWNDLHFYSCSSLYVYYSLPYMKL